MDRHAAQGKRLFKGAPMKGKHSWEMERIPEKKSCELNRGKIKDSWEKENSFWEREKIPRNMAHIPGNKIIIILGKSPTVSDTNPDTIRHYLTQIPTLFNTI